LGLFDSSEEHPPSKILRYIITAAVFLGLLGGTAWWMLRFHAEKVTVHHFMNAVVAGDMQRAYKIWQPAPSYSYDDFVKEDWGPYGYYGPVRSYEIKNAEMPRGGSSAAAVTVELSPYAPFPSADDAIKQSNTKEVVLWVDLKNQSISFPPD
jgi:hypothetical protein